MNRLIKLTIPFLLLIPVIALSGSNPQRFRDPAFRNPQREAALFDHDGHIELESIDENCSICHHLYENGQPVEDESTEDQSCSECHAVKKEKGKTSLIEAYHQQCIGCHTRLKQGPVMCGQCHKQSQTIKPKGIIK